MNFEQALATATFQNIFDQSRGMFVRLVWNCVGR
jgi:hypothetical protein